MYDPATTDLIFIVVNIHYLFTGRAEEVGLMLIFPPFIFIRFTTAFTPQPYPTILTEVNIYPSVFTALFWLVSGHYSHQAL
jgi:hypothetical protein